MKASKKQLAWAAGIFSSVIAGIRVITGSKALQQKNKQVASTPIDLSWQSWRRAAIETKDAFANKNITMLASGVAYGWTLAFFPLVAATVAIASLVVEPYQITDVIHALNQYLPKDIASLISTQLTNAAGNSSANIWIAIISIGIAVFGVSGAMSSIINAVNIAYDVKETRHIVTVRLLSMGLSALMIVGLIIVLPLILLGTGFLRRIGVPRVFIDVFSLLRWPLLAVLLSFSLSIFYRYAPNRPNAKWQWVSWGAIMATLLWLAGTAVFFVYLQYFAHFSDSYSLFAGIIALMMWLNHTGLIVLLGAEINHQLESRVVPNGATNA